MWIKTIAPGKADGELDEIYRVIDSARGGVAEIHRVQSLNPRALKAHDRPRVFRPLRGLQIQGIMPGANTKRDTNRTTWLSHADKSIAGESGRRAVSQAETAAEALGPCPAEENGSKGQGGPGCEQRLSGR
jgi:hypothetical protein